MKIITHIQTHNINSSLVRYFLNDLHLKTDYCYLDEKEICIGAGFKVEKDTEKFYKIISLLEQNKVEYSVINKADFSKKEIESSSLFSVLDSFINIDINENDNKGKALCSHCQSGLTLTGPLKININQLKSNRINIVTYNVQEFIWVIHKRYACYFENFSGIIFEPVIDTSRKKNNDSFLALRFYNILDAMDKRTNFIPNGRPYCRYCNIPGRTLYEDMYYSDDTIKRAIDFNLTQEYFGGGAPIRWVLVSQRVRQTILQNKLLTFGCFRPVVIVASDTNAYFETK